MIKPDLIVRTNRRSMSLTISRNGELIVHAPKKLNLTKILSFIDEKKSWIIKKQNEIKTNGMKNKSIIDYEKFLVFGKVYNILEFSSLKRIELLDSSIACPVSSDKINRVNNVLKWYFKLSKETLKERIDYFANIMQLNYNSLTINNSKTRWGTCDINGNIKLNFRLIMLPYKVIDFVVIHELSHLVEFNHSKNFYKIIETLQPDYKCSRNILKENGYLLGLYR